MNAKNLKVSTDTIPFKDELRNLLSMIWKGIKKGEHRPILRQIRSQNHAIHVKDGNPKSRR